MDSESAYFFSSKSIFKMMRINLRTVHGQVCNPSGNDMGGGEMFFAEIQISQPMATHFVCSG